MASSIWLAALLLFPLQVPRPSAGEEESRELESARRAILSREAVSLERLAADLDRDRQTGAARLVRALIPPPADPDGPTRIVPLPDVVPAPRDAGKPGPADARLAEIRARSAAELYELAQKAAKGSPPRYGMAGLCLRAALDRAPDHPQVRRLLGYVPHQKGWARPFAIEQNRKGLIDHPVFGWVKADWKEHLEQGELPSPPGRGGKVKWLPAAEADRLRADWNPPWQIGTEHFQIQTNVPLAEAISFGRRLEAFHDLFMTLMADVQGDNSPLARRFRDAGLTGEPARKPHLVYYYASRQEYLDHLIPRYGQDIARSLGFYDPPRSGTGRTPAYFFRDPDGQLPVTANLYHEVSHQLLFETAGSNNYTRNFGNYWVFEGLGTYFETVEPQPDGSIEVGGRVGRRMEEAIRSLVGLHRTIPLREFIAYDESAFRRDDPQIFLRYQEGMALTTFLMQARDGIYREAFLDYVRDAYHGWIKRSTGRSLEDRLGESCEDLEAKLLAFLAAADRRSPAAAAPAAGPQPQPPPSGAIRTVPSARPQPKPAASGAIRTVPSH